MYYSPSPCGRGLGGGGSPISNHVKNSRTRASVSARIVDLVMRRVDREAGARGAVQTEPVHQRLGAVMAGAHRDALAIQQRRHVVRMRPIQRERHHAAAILRPAQDVHALDRVEPRQRVIDQRCLMRGDRVVADRLHVIDRRLQSDAFQDRRRARLELVRHLGPGGTLVRHRRDHLAAAEERRHRVEQLATSPQHADARRAIQLVPGEGVEIAVQRLHIDPPMHHRLRAVEQHLRAMRVRDPHDALGRRVGAQHVGHVRHRHQADAAVGQQRLERRPCRARRHR